MIGARACAGIVALGVSCLTANAWSGESKASAEPPAASPAVEVGPQARPWLAKPQPKTIVAAGESSSIPWKSAILIAGALVAGALVWRHRRKWRAFAAAKPNARLSITGSVRVGPKAHLVLAQVGDRALLLGVTDDSVRRIAWIDQPVVESERTSETRLDPRIAPQPERKFLEILRGLSGRIGSIGAGGSSGGASLRQPGEAALEIAGASRDTVEWSTGAAAAKRARPFGTSPKAASAASSDKPAAFGAASSAPSAKSAAHGEASKPAALSEAIKPFALAEATHSSPAEESTAPGPRAVPDDRDAIEEQAAGVVRRKARRRA